jgi:hypothetical protein
MEFEFSGEVFEWRGPSPFYFVRVPDDMALEIRAVSSLVTYGWGVIPATIRIGSTRWATSLFPKDGGYLVPLKDAVRRAEDLIVGDEVTLGVRVGR